MKKFVKILGCVCTIILMVSCKKTEEQRIARHIKHWEEKGIVSPEDYASGVYGGKDTLSSFSQEWKRIGDDTYTLEIPADWYTKAVDKNAVRTSEWAAKQGFPRKVTLYEKHNLQVRHDTIWFSPETEESSAKPMVMNLRVRSFVSRNNSSIPFHIVEELATASVLGVLDTQREECGKGKVKVVILEKNMDIHGGKIKRYNLYRYIVLQQSEKIVHAVEVSIKEKYLKEHPDKLKDIERILNSFEVK